MSLSLLLQTPAGRINWGKGVADPDLTNPRQEEKLLGSQCPPPSAETGEKPHHWLCERAHDLTPSVTLCILSRSANEWGTEFTHFCQSLVLMCFF